MPCSGRGDPSAPTGECAFLERSLFVEKVETHLDYLRRLLDLIADARTRRDPHVDAALSLYVANLFSEIEHVLKLFARQAGLDLPAGDDWHKQLVGWFAPGSDRNLPVLFSDAIRPHVDELRRYRHVSRVHSAVTLDHSKIHALLPRAIDVAETFILTVRAVE